VITGWIYSYDVETLKDRVRCPLKKYKVMYKVYSFFNTF